jgi:hypothetical protein
MRLAYAPSLCAYIIPLAYATKLFALIMRLDYPHIISANLCN